MINLAMKECFVQTVMMSQSTYLWKISNLRQALIITSESCLCKKISISQTLPTDKCTDMKVHSFCPLDKLRLSQEIRGGSARRYDTLRIRHRLEEFGFFSINICEFKY